MVEREKEGLWICPSVKSCTDKKCGVYRHDIPHVYNDNCRVCGDKEKMCPSCIPFTEKPEPKEGVCSACGSILEKDSTCLKCLDFILQNKGTGKKGEPKEVRPSNSEIIESLIKGIRVDERQQLSKYLSEEIEKKSFNQTIDRVFTMRFIETSEALKIISELLTEEK